MVFSDTATVRIVSNYRILFVADVPSSGLPKLSNLAKSGNRARQAMRPKDPKDLHFLVADMNFPEDFHRADLSVGNKRLNILIKCL